MGGVSTARIKGQIAALRKARQGSSDAGRVLQAALAGTPTTTARVQKAMQQAATLTGGGSAPSRQPQARSQSRAQKTLNNYVAMNGNMGLPRREQTVIPALQRLGYPHADAERIALGAPLNNGMTDTNALDASLIYADSLSPSNFQATLAADPRQAALLQGAGPINTPPQAAAAAALASGRAQPINRPPGAGGAIRQAKMRANRPATVIGMTRGSFERVGRRFAEWATPSLDAISQLPVRGGLGGMFLLNLAFLAAVVPANAQGYTRLQLLWASLWGQTEWAGKTPPAKASAPDSVWQRSLIGLVGGVEETAVAVQQVAGAISGQTPPGLGTIIGAGIAGLTGGTLSTSPTPPAPPGNGPSQGALPPQPPSGTF